MVATHLVQTKSQDGVEFTASDGKTCRVMFNRDDLTGGSVEITQDGKTLVRQQLLL
jgi:hypothetical protein